VSIPGVRPSAYVTWFQAAAACRNAGKRLATNEEWQMAALGTPDPGTDNGTSDCNISTAGTLVKTGSRSLCLSDVGAFDMVGNLNEWVADWRGAATDCTNWDAAHGNDISCIGGDGSINLPGALMRGGGFGDGTGAGVFAVDGRSDPSTATGGIGFRCANSDPDDAGGDLPVTTAPGR
jgi:formylglycine-generating enzyme required for sulfatase activity